MCREDLAGYVGNIGMTIWETHSTNTQRGLNFKPLLIADRSGSVFPVRLPRADSSLLPVQERFLKFCGIFLFVLLFHFLFWGKFTNAVIGSPLITFYSHYFFSLITFTFFSFVLLCLLFWSLSSIFYSRQSLFPYVLIISLRF